MIVRKPPKLQPLASIEHQARACCDAIKDLAARPGMKQIVVIVDRENRPDPPSLIADQLATTIREFFPAVGVAIDVVIKDVAYENWLYADPGAFSACRGRFMPLSTSQLRPEAQVDGRDVRYILEQICIGTSFHKVKDAVRLAPNISPEAASARSKTFALFHRLVTT